MFRQKATSGLFRVAGKVWSASLRLIARIPRSATIKYSLAAWQSPRKRNAAAVANPPYPGSGAGFQCRRQCRPGELPPLSLSAIFPTEDVEEAANFPKAGEKAGGIIRAHSSLSLLGTGLIKRQKRPAKSEARSPLFLEARSPECRTIGRVNFIATLLLSLLGTQLIGCLPKPKQNSALASPQVSSFKAGSGNSGETCIPRMPPSGSRKIARKLAACLRTRARDCIRSRPCDVMYFTTSPPVSSRPLRASEDKGGGGVVRVRQMRHEILFLEEFFFLNRNSESRIRVGFQD